MGLKFGEFTLTKFWQGKVLARKSFGKEKFGEWIDQAKNND